MATNCYTVIMAGGVGTRFWPVSRTGKPKQFLDILGTGNTMLQDTARRFDGISDAARIMVVTNKIYESLVAEQLPSLPQDNILCETIGRNTAPCIAYAAYKIYEKDPDAVMIVAPSDHVVQDTAEFAKLMKMAVKKAGEEELLITLGIKPNRPDTGYGYIQFREDAAMGEFKKVKTFTEKPKLELAKQFVESGEFFWNAGIFVWKVKTIIKSLEKHLPDIAKLFLNGRGIYYTAKEPDFIQDAYTQCINISIDYGVMEKADNVYILPADFGWSDVGTWKSLYELSKKDEHQNVVQAQHHLISDTENCIIRMSDGKMAVINGLKDFIIAEHDNVLMICPKDSEQKVKDYVSDLKVKKMNEFL